MVRFHTLDGRLVKTARVADLENGTADIAAGIYHAVTLDRSGAVLKATSHVVR